jgi:hypothetical protein
MHLSPSAIEEGIRLLENPEPGSSHWRQSGDGADGQLKKPINIEERWVEAAGVETELAGFSNLLMARDF